MNLLLFLQQLVEPVIAAWPVWLCVALIVWGLSYSQLVALKKWGIRFVFVLFFLTIALRAFVLGAFPYAERTSIIEYDEKAAVPLVVTYNHGKFSLRHKEIDQLQYNSWDLATGFRFEKHFIDEVVGSENLNRDAYHIYSHYGDSLLTRIHRSAELSVPRNFGEMELFAFYETNADLDFTNAVAEQVVIRLNFSEANVRLPVSPRIDAKYEIYGSSKTTLSIMVPDQTTCRLRDTQGTIRDIPAGFEKTADGEYFHAGKEAETGEILLVVGVYNPRSLAVSVVNTQ